MVMFLPVICCDHFCFQCDIVVNSCSSDLKLDRGLSSKAILQAAGSGIQQEISGKYPVGIQPGEVAITSAGSMHCKHIFHIAVKHYDHKDKQGSMSVSFKVSMFKNYVHY